MQTSLAQLTDVDGRRKPARRWKRTLTMLAEQLGGLEGLSELELLDLSRAASMTVALEKMDARIAQGEEIDLNNYAFVTSEVTRVLQRLGLVDSPKRTNGHVSPRRN